MPDERIAAIAARQHGVFTEHQARSVGFSEKGIRWRVATGRWVKLYRGVHAIAGAPRTEEQRVIAAVLSMGPRAVAGSLTAAWLYGLIEKPPDLVYVAMPSGQHRRRRRCIALIEATLTRTDVRTINAIPVTAPNRTIVDIAAVLPRKHLGAALDEAVVLGFTTVGAVRRYVKDRRLGHRPGARNLRLVLDDRTKGVSRRGLEKLFRRKLRASDLPEPVRQHPIGDSFIDFAYPDANVAIELDGLRDHFSEEAFKSDRRRQNEIVLAGYDVLRFTWEDVDARWPRVVETIRRALDSA